MSDLTLLQYLVIILYAGGLLLAGLWLILFLWRLNKRHQPKYKRILTAFGILLALFLTINGIELLVNLFFQFFFQTSFN